LKFQAVAEKTAKDSRGLLYFATPGTKAAPHTILSDNPFQGFLFSVSSHTASFSARTLLVGMVWYTRV